MQEHFFPDLGKTILAETREQALQQLNLPSQDTVAPILETTPEPILEESEIPEEITNQEITQK